MHINRGSNHRSSPTVTGYVSEVPVIQQATLQICRCCLQRKNSEGDNAFYESRRNFQDRRTLLNRRNQNWEMNWPELGKGLQILFHLFLKKDKKN